MVSYTCERCNYNSDHISNYLRHLQNKSQCEPIHSNKDTKTIYDEFMNNRQSKKPCICDVCDRRFSCNFSLTRHKKTHTNEGTNVINTTSQSHNTSTASSHNTSTEHSHNTEHSYNTTNNTNHTNSHNTTNNTTNINITNLNIELKTFGNERMDYILEDKELLTTSLKSSLQKAIPELFKKIHMNTDVPENQNIKFKRIHPPKMVTVYEENDEGVPHWIDKVAEPVIEAIVKNCVDILFQHDNYIQNNRKEPATDFQRDYEVQRLQKLLDIKNKVRGSEYVPSRDGIFTELQNDAQKHI
jgi:hypothetical protein